MVITINEKIRRILVESNPHWKGDYRPNLKGRAAYQKIRERMKERQIIVLCGLRRTGKTSIMQMMISDLLKTAKGDEILYFPFDDFEGGEIYPVLDEFAELHNHAPKYVFLDEVQKLDNWAEKVKILYDSGKYGLAVSGSESLFLLEGSRESLAGRVYEFEIENLSFSEYLDFAGKKELAEKPGVYDAELKAEFKNYLLSGGFPEMAGKTDAALIREYVKTSVVEKIVYKDMARLYPIDNPRSLISILEILNDNPGMQVDFDSFSRELSLTRQTVSKYFDYLERAHLVRKLYNFSKNRSTSEKRLKKFYPTCITSAMSDRADDEYFSKIVESACVLRSGAKYFWRDARKNEVDMVFWKGKDILPVEVKYRNRPERENSLLIFCKKFNCKEAILVTKTANKEEKEEARIHQVPAHIFMLGGYFLK